MSPYPASVAATFDEARGRLRALVAETDPDTFNRKPSPKAWSAGECVDHLNRTAEGLLPRIEEAFGPGAPRGAAPDRPEWGWMARRFIAAVTPGSRPLPTGGPMKPPAAKGDRSDVDPDRALARFDADTDRWLALCERSDGLDHERIKVRSPFLPVVKLPAAAFVEAMGQHALRHVGQAERAVRGA